MIRIPRCSQMYKAGKVFPYYMAMKQWSRGNGYVVDGCIRVHDYNVEVTLTPRRGVSVNDDRAIHAIQNVMWAQFPLEMRIVVSAFLASLWWTATARKIELV